MQTQIMSLRNFNFRVKFQPMVKQGPLPGAPPLTDGSVDSILAWRWVVLAIGIASTVAFEVAEGHSLREPGFVVEFLTSGLLVPLVGWLFMTALAMALRRRAKSDFYFNLHRSITVQLRQRQSMEELAQYIVQLPGQLQHGSQASLFVYDHNQARFEFGADSRRLASGVPFLCQTCSAMTAGRPSPLTYCSLRENHHCLRLAYDNIMVGVLMMDSPSGRKLPKDQEEFLAEVSPELALALALQIAFPRQIAAARTAGEANERERISYDLHDNLAQQVSYLHMALDRLTADETVAGNAHLLSELERARSVAEEVYNRVRTTLTVLRSQMIGDLSALVAEQAAKAGERANFKPVVDVSGEPSPVPLPWSQDVFALVRESLNNIEKHSGAHEVRIQMDWSPETLAVLMTDDGVGFDPAAPRPDGHYGLTMMAERMARLQGQLNIESTRGHGTRLYMRVPLPEGVRQRTRQGLSGRS